MRNLCTLACMTFIRDTFLLIARVILGVVMIAHGWQKYNDWTVEGTGQNFSNMGVPMPELSAQFATYFEIGGGILLIIGLLVRLVGPILAVLMAGAAWFVHLDSGIFASDGGWELVGVIAAGGLALAAAGAGRISVDHLLAAPFRRRKAEKEAKARGEHAGSLAHTDARTDARYDDAQYAAANRGDAQYGDKRSNNFATGAAAGTAAGAGAGVVASRGNSGSNGNQAEYNNAQYNDAQYNDADAKTTQFNSADYNQGGQGAANNGEFGQAKFNDADQRAVANHQQNAQNNAQHGVQRGDQGVHGVQQGGVTAEHDYSEARTEQINVGDADYNSADFKSGKAPEVDSDAPTTQWPGDTRKK